MRKNMKRLEFDLTEGGTFLRVPNKDDWSGKRSDNMVLAVYGQKKSGQWVQVEARVSRNQIESLAGAMHRIIALEQEKVDTLRAAMKGQTA